MPKDSASAATFMVGVIPHAVSAGAQNVAGPGFHPFGAHVVLAAEALRPDDGNRQVFRQPRIGRHRILLHRLFKPCEIEFFQLFADPQRLGAAVPVIAINHQVNIRPYGFAHRRAGFNVHFGIGRKRDWRHPVCSLMAL